MNSSTVTLRIPFDEQCTFRVSGDAEDRSVVRVIVEQEGHYEPDIMNLLHRVLSRDAVVLDVGANIGTISLVLHHLVPDGQVHAFEPSAHNLAHLRANVERNGAQNISVHPFALSDSRGTATLSYQPGFSGGAFISDHVHEYETEVVTTMPLDDWVEEAGLDRLDLMKLDVEGAELQVLAGAERTLARFRSTLDLIVECNPIALQRLHGKTAADLYARLRRLYKGVFHVRDQGGIVRILSLGHLWRLLTEEGFIDLYCTNKVPLRLDLRTLRGLSRSARELSSLYQAFNPFREPRNNYVVRPAYSLRFPVNELHVSAGAFLTLGMELVNESSSWLSSRFANSPVTLGYEWLTPSGTAVEQETPRSFLPKPLRPGGKLTVPLHVLAPAEPGRYILRASLVQEGFAWFHQLDPSLGPTLNAHVR